MEIGSVVETVVKMHRTRGQIRAKAKVHIATEVVTDTALARGGTPHRTRVEQWCMVTVVVVVIVRGNRYV